MCEIARGGVIHEWGCINMLNDKVCLVTACTMTMVLEKEIWRAMIYYNYKVGLRQLESFTRFSAAFGDEAPSCAMLPSIWW